MLLFLLFFQNSQFDFFDGNWTVSGLTTSSDIFHAKSKLKFYFSKLSNFNGIEMIPCFSTYSNTSRLRFASANISYLTVLALRNQRDDKGNRVYKEWPASIAEHIGLRALFLGGNNIGKVPDTETISYLIYTLDISDNPNIIINVSDVCPYIKAGMYTLIYDPTQDIRGCDALDLE